jgi:hypothetical protein
VGTVVCKRRRALEIVCGAIGQPVVMKVNVLLGTMKTVVRIVATVGCNLAIAPATKIVPGICGTTGRNAPGKARARPLLKRVRPVATAELRAVPAVIPAVGSPGRPARARGSVRRTPSKIKKRLVAIAVHVIANAVAVTVVSGIHGANGPNVLKGGHALRAIRIVRNSPAVIAELRFAIGNVRTIVFGPRGPFGDPALVRGFVPAEPRKAMNRDAAIAVPRAAVVAATNPVPGAPGLIGGLVVKRAFASLGALRAKARSAGTVAPRIAREIV